MGKIGRKDLGRRLESNQARAVAKNLRVSPRKLSLVGGLIRNMRAFDAVIQLEFCNKRIAKDVKKCLQSAIANAENNHFLDVDNLYVKEVVISKALVMKRFRARARGRAAGIKKFFSNIAITLEESGE